MLLKYICAGARRTYRLIISCIKHEILYQKRPVGLQISDRLLQLCRKDQPPRPSRRLTPVFSTPRFPSCHFKGRFTTSHPHLPPLFCLTPPTACLSAQRKVRINSGADDFTLLSSPPATFSCTFLVRANQHIVHHSLADPLRMMSLSVHRWCSTPGSLTFSPQYKNTNTYKIKLPLIGSVTCQG